MEWSTIWEAISPYINTTTIIAVATLIIKVVLGIKKNVNLTAQQLKNTALLDEKKIAELVGGLLPTKLSVSVKPLVESEQR